MYVLSFIFEKIMVRFYTKYDINKPLHMNIADMKKPVMEMIEYEEGVATKFLVMRKSDGKQ